MFEMRKTPQGEKLSAGYPAVEDLIESEQFDPINHVFGDAYAQLSEMTKKKTGLKTAKGARAAMRAIDHVMELFKELLAVKYALLRRQEGKTK